MARKESKEGVKPLLYIAQPDFAEAKLNVQHSYVVKVNNQEQEAKEKNYVATKVDEIDELEEIEDIEDIEEIEDLDEIEEETDEEIEEKGWVKKPFKAMTNEEKVLFMVNKPHFIPKVDCRIRTKNNLFIGYIVAYNEGVVSVKVSSSANNIEIRLDEIESIQMIGI